MTDQPTESELKPCPLCGSPVIMSDWPSRNSQVIGLFPNDIVCPTCHFGICGHDRPRGETDEILLALWNRSRPAETELQSLRSEVERLLEERDSAKSKCKEMAKDFECAFRLTRQENDTLKSQNAELVKALRPLYEYCADISSPDTRCESTMMTNARAVIAKTGGAK